MLSTKGGRCAVVALGLAAAAGAVADPSSDAGTSARREFYLVTATKDAGQKDAFASSRVGKEVVQLPYVAAAGLRRDNDAITSAQHGLDAALLERDLVMGLVQTGTRDVNARLFRLRSGDTVPRGPEGEAVAESDVAKRISGITTRRRLIVGGDAMAGAPARRGPSFDLYATGDAGTWHRDEQDGSDAVRSHLFAGGLGAEWRSGSGWALGLAGSLLDGDAWLDGADADYDLTGWTASPYVSYRGRRWYADARYSFSRVELDLRRRTGAGGTAKASTDSDVHSFALNAGFDALVVGGLRTGPIGGLDYLTGDLGGYHESGSSRGAVKVSAQSFDSLVSHVGWQASWRVPTAFGALTPQVRVEWAHEYLAHAEEVEAWLRRSPYDSGSRQGDRYKTSGKSRTPDRDTARLGAGMMMEFSRTAALLLDYEADLQDADGIAQRGSLTLSLRF